HRVHARGAARALVVTAVVLSAVLAVATFRRNRVWASDISLWSDAAQKSPGKSRPHMDLGTALGAAGRLDDAARELRRAVELDPASSYARAQLGATLLALGRPAEAEPELREAVRLQPGDPEALFNLGMVLLRTGRVDDAKPFMKRFLEVAPPALVAARRLAERALR
ncbi:MAG TPA: tetratricopeptide repeat protein, partial [Anaeromyxobacteraceae bacterium]